jgi:vacuolar-type H+-ATPase subunit I/STV1
MAGINLSQLNIPKSEEPVKRKHVVRLDELSDAYSNPDKKKENLNNEQPTKMRELRYVRGVENEPIKKGELKKPESKIERIDKQLEKVEKKTDRLIAKNKSITERVEQPHDSLSNTASIQQANAIHTSPLHHSRLLASYFDFISMSPKKLPKQILNHIRDRSFFHNGECFSSIDTYELISKTNKKAHHLSTQISRMESQGWFQIVKSSSAGHRTVQIDPKHYGI